MSRSTPEQLRFSPVAGLTVRAAFDGGAMSSDFGPLILRGVDRQIGLIDRLVQAVDDRRHPSYVAHSLRDLFTQRIFQIARGYPDGNDANALRTDPPFKLGANRHPLALAMDLASGPTFSRLDKGSTSRSVKLMVLSLSNPISIPTKQSILALFHWKYRLSAVASSSICCMATS